jgi:hypothetical protein
VKECHAENFSQIGVALPLSIKGLNPEYGQSQPAEHHQPMDWSSI